MKKLLITMLAASMLAAPSTHAKNHTSSSSIADRIYQLSVQAGLSDVQEARIKAILQRLQPQITGLKVSGKLAKADKQHLKELKKMRAAEIDAVLTPQQRVLLKEMKSERRADDSKRRVKRA
jgi:hypothetical protein